MFLYIQNYQLGNIPIELYSLACMSTLHIVILIIFYFQHGFILNLGVLLYLIWCALLLYRPWVQNKHLTDQHRFTHSTSLPSPPPPRTCVDLTPDVTIWLRSPNQFNPEPVVSWCFASSCIRWSPSAHTSVATYMGGFGWSIWGPRSGGGGLDSSMKIVCVPSRMHHGDVEQTWGYCWVYVHNCWLNLEKKNNIKLIMYSIPSYPYIENHIHRYWILYCIACTLWKVRKIPHMY